jgi:hypothetical protein
MLEELMSLIDSGRERLDFNVSSFTSFSENVIQAVRSCRHIDRNVGHRVAADLELALSQAGEIDRY